MQDEVIALERLDRSRIALVGGKAANLGELVRIAGVRVPHGFCVTTAAFTRVAGDPGSRIGELVARLDGTDDGETTAELRSAIGALTVPQDVTASIVAALGTDPHASWAVRSSATAEDLPDASFAGQQDTFLHVIGADAVLDAIRACWASLFTDRAVSYRRRSGIDHRAVQMAVIVQRMVDPHAAGVAFTADPVTGDRTVVTIEACLGLGEGLVSGVTDPDRFTVRGGDIVARTVADKQIALRPAAGGGTRCEQVDLGDRSRPSLTDEEVLALAQLARRIEAHFGCPQDIEWCLAGGDLHVLQSRPITTAYPVPDATSDTLRVYVSVGHQQMMTDAMRPLGLSMWQLVAARPMHEAGGRLFVDVTDMLASPATRPALLGTLGRSDPLVLDALETLVERGVVPPPPGTDPAPSGSLASPSTDEEAGDLATLVEQLMAEADAAVAEAHRVIGAARGEAVFDAIAGDLEDLRRTLFDPRSMQLIAAAVESTAWLIDHLADWLGEPGAVDALAQSVPHNVTAAMGLALLDVADVIRARPDVVDVLRRIDGVDVLRELAAVDGGREAADAIAAFVDRYGMRCAGEIDITRPRWREDPSALVPLLLTNVDRFEPGEAIRRHEQGLQRAAAKRADVLAQLRVLPDGDAKADETEQVIERMRAVIGYREFPKYTWMCRFDVYRRALLGEARRLVDAGALDDVDDAVFLRFDELRGVARSGRADRELVARRRADFAVHRRLTPPRVLTSDGEAVSGSYRRDDLPDGALAGLAVSSGVVEGRARVVADIADATLEAGDVLVTAHTDPSWTPLFLTIAGLVTEVGGLMTHGAVIAREYGLPAVVGVQHATTLIRDGQHIRVDGTHGYVTVLDRPTTP
jgi:pyruvate,water dikinase